jgi:hypothetical protein
MPPALCHNADCIYLEGMCAKKGYEFHLVIVCVPTRPAGLGLVLQCSYNNLLGCGAVPQPSRDLRIHSWGSPTTIHCLQALGL